MKVLIFAHTPPPHHGQSFMVEQLVAGFGGADYGIEIFHVNARFADATRDIGKFRFEKIFLLAKYILRAVWIRFRHNVKIFYYIPAPPLRNAIIRDWVILLACRMFFPRLILHWHAAGLAGWVKAASPVARALTHRALDHADMAIALSEFNQREAEVFEPQRTAVIPNGIPDPCPNFEKALSHRKATRGAIVRVLYMSLAIREKGVFDAIEGVRRANEISPIRFRLTIAGRFFEPAQEREFGEALERLPQGMVEHVGFVEGSEKIRLLTESDIFCFPSYYAAENSPVALIEALAFGLPIVTTRWRSIPEYLSPGYPGLVDVRSPDQIARALLNLAGREDSQILRAIYRQNYSLHQHLTALAKAFQEVRTS